MNYDKDFVKKMYIHSDIDTKREELAKELEQLFEAGSIVDTIKLLVDRDLAREERIRAEERRKTINETLDEVCKSRGCSKSSTQGQTCRECDIYKIELRLESEQKK